MSEDPTMARVTFRKDFDYKPTSRKLFAYKAGQTLTVKRECAEAAIAAGKAFERKPPSRRKPQA